MKATKRSEKQARKQRATSAPFSISTRRILIIASVLAIATFLLYVPTFWNGFIFGYDDNEYVQDNGVVPKGLTFEGIYWAFTTDYFANWLPITWLSHMLDVSLFGMNPGGHHAMSALLHGLNAALLLMCLYRLTGWFGPSLAAALLFAVHPLRVESVAWVAERKDVLAGTFFLLAVLSYTKYVRQPTVARFALVALWHALGLMSKTMIVTLPAVLLLLDWWPLGRLRLGRLLPATTRPADEEQPSRGEASPEPAMKPVSIFRLVLEKVPLLLLSAVASAWTIVLQRTGGATEYGEVFTLSQRLANAVVSIGRYLRKMVFPADLAVLYPHPGDWAMWIVVVSLILVIGVSALCWMFRRRAPYLLVGWAWFLVMLLPVIGIMQAGMQSIADRYTYLPGIGVTVAVVWLAAGALRRRGDGVARRSWIPATITGVIAAGFAVVTVIHERFWADKFTLFSHAVAVTDGNWLAHSHVGSGYYEMGRYDEAMQHFRRSFEINPRFANGHQNLANVLFKVGREPEAEAHYREAVRIDPTHWLAYKNYAAMLKSLGRHAEAVAMLEQAVRLQPDAVDLKVALAAAMVGAGRSADASALLVSAGLTTEAAQTRYNAGNALAAAGRLAEAAEEYRAATRIVPRFAQAHHNLGVILSRMNQVGPAIEAYREAVRLNPNHAQAWFNLGAMLIIQGKAAEAAEAYGSAVRVRPDWVDARVGFGETLLVLNRMEEASAQAVFALRLEPRNPAAIALARKIQGR